MNGVTIAIGTIVWIGIAALVVMAFVRRRNRGPCPHCGLSVDGGLDTCPYCRAALR